MTEQADLADRIDRAGDDYEVDLVVHATHEAGLKLGGIGAVLDGLLSAPSYLQNVGRTVLVGPMDTTDKTEMERLTAPRNRLEIHYSSFHRVNQATAALAAALAAIETDCGVHILYGTRAFGDARHEVLLVDAGQADEEMINLFKGRIWWRYGIPSDRYEHHPEYSYYVNAAEPSFLALQALVGEDIGRSRHGFIVAHEFMGLPLVFAGTLNAPGAYRSIFYGHEVATVRSIVEEHLGHDTMFYNVMARAKAEGKWLAEVFGDQSGFFKHALLSAAPECDNVFAVGDRIVDEMRFLGPAFAAKNIDLVYNGVPSYQISLEEKLASRCKLQQYAVNLGLCDAPPDLVFTHVTRMIVSKGLWRDIRVLEHLDAALADRGQRAVLYILSTIIPVGRPAEEILRMEKEYGWPVVHREGAPDLISHEIPFYHAVAAFNQAARATQIVFVNQFGWSRDRCGERMPADMEFTDIRQGSDLEFGQSIYEPFGIAQVEPLSFGALCVISDVCGCVGFLQRVAPADQRNVIVADYTTLPPGVAEGGYDAALGIGQAQRDAVEATNAGRVADEILARLPQTPEAMGKAIEAGYRISQRMSWEVVAADYLLPGLRRATGRD
ncbi:MAG: hypothetical protein JSV36_09155 [Anaerolineae bacterium]|nr:MAG: hypothetical protein JSV36_09155 [Anaerolineae bacterium]